MEARKMKKLMLVIVAMFIATTGFAQRATYMWSNDNVKTVSGVITDNQRPCAILKADDGKEYRVHLGPIWYWEQNGYSLSLSNATIKGNVKEINGVYDIFPFTIEQSGKVMMFADDNGIPKWSQGKGWGRGYGRGYGYGRGRGWNCPYRR